MAGVDGLHLSGLCRHATKVAQIRERTWTGQTRGSVRISVSDGPLSSTIHHPSEHGGVESRPPISLGHPSLERGQVIVVGHEGVHLVTVLRGRGPDFADLRPFITVAARQGAQKILWHARILRDDVAQS